MKRLSLLLMLFWGLQTAVWASLNVTTYRWRNDNGTVATATWRADENQATTSYNPAENLRLRMKVCETNDSNYDPVINVLAYGTSESGPWTQISSDANNAFVMSESPVADAGFSSDELLSGCANYLGGSFIEAEGGINLAIAASSSTELEFCIKATANATAPTYYFVLYEDGAMLGIRPRLDLEYCPKQFDLSNESTHTVCSDGMPASISVSNSQAAFSYQLKKDGADLGPPVSNHQGPLDFVAAEAGVYTVVATNPNNGCTAEMTGSATISVSAATAPAPPTVNVSNLPFCTGEILSVQAAAASGEIRWFSDGFGQNLYSSTPELTNSPTESTSFWAAVSDANNCLSLPVQVDFVQKPTPNNITLANASGCNGQSTTCNGDDSFTAEVTVHYDAKPATGMLTLSGADILSGITTVDLADAGATSHTFTGINLRADGQSVDLTATFSDACGHTQSVGTAPAACSGVTQAIYIDAACYGGTYNFTGYQNGAPRWDAPNSYLYWTGSYWMIRLNYTPVTAARTYDGNINTLPCTGWFDDDLGCGPPNSLSSCGSFLATQVTDISLENVGSCQNNGTSDVRDDYFTANVRVNYTEAPETDDLTLKQGDLVLASKPGSEISCFSTWLFENVQIPIVGSSVILTAHFSPATAVSKYVGAAPNTCSDLDGDGYQGNTDCDDTNASIYPFAPENCNRLGTTGMDDDCDGTIDEDWSPPTAICKDVVLPVYGPTDETLTVGSVDNGSSDACSTPDNLSLSVSPALFNCEDVGTHVVTLNVQDESGNSSQCTANITVQRLLDYAGIPGRRTANEAASGDKYGWSIASKPGYVLTGAPEDKVGNITKQGSAYLLERDGETFWWQLQQFKASDGAASDFFGRSVALTEEFAFVGAELDNIGANTDQGSAYIFDWAGQQLKQIKASDGEAYEYFGNAMSADGEWLLVGALSEKNGATTNIGAAYLFGQNMGGDNNWGQAKKLTASDRAASHKFGTSIGISGNTALAGAPGHNGSRGAAYIFEKDLGGPNNWGEAKKLIANDAAAGDLFGTSVAIAGDFAIVGAYGKGTSRGYAYIFYRNQGGANNWGQVKKIAASDGAAGARFGWSVKIGGDNAYVGAPNANGGKGAVYVYSRHYGGLNNWGQMTAVSADDGSTNDQFGYAVAAADEQLAVGAALDDAPATDQGSVYIFEAEVCNATAPRTRQDAGDEKAAASEDRSETTTSPVTIGSELAVFCSPNPFRDELKIEIEKLRNWEIGKSEIGEASAFFDIQIMDARGRVVVQKTLAPGQKTWQWQTGDAPSGLYFVQVSGDFGVRVLPVNLVR